MRVAVDAFGKTGVARETTRPGFTTSVDRWIRGYNLAPDNRLLVIHDVPSEFPPLCQINVVVNWFTDSERQVPVS